MTQRHIVLALDFDGVLHPLNSRTESMFCRLDLLEAWLRGRPAIRVLIASSWREAHPLDVLVSFFSEDLQRRVVGVTPVYEKMLSAQSVRSSEEARYRRQVEVERWMADSGLSVRRLGRPRR